MKTFKHIIFGVLMLTASYVQAQDFMEELASEICECAEGISKEDGNMERVQMELGMCMIEKSQKYKKQLRKEYDINVDNFEEDIERLGELVGVQMAAVCPNTLLSMVGDDQLEEIYEEEEAQKTFMGTISKVEDSKFIVFTVKNKGGKTSKFYWLTFVDSNLDLMENYKTLTDQQVSVTYIQQEFFDSRIGEYRLFNVITEIELFK